jgi:hypothetical protein
MRFADGSHGSQADFNFIAFIVVVLVVVIGSLKREARRSLDSPGFAGNSSLTMSAAYSVVLPERGHTFTAIRVMPRAKRDTGAERRGVGRWMKGVAMSLGKLSVNR